VLGAYITLFASRRLLASFRKLIVAHQVDATIVADLDFMARVYRDLGSRFPGFMVTQAHSTGLRKQRFYATFMARYHGLSILGLRHSVASCDRVLREVVLEAKAKVRIRKGCDDIEYVGGRNHLFYTQALMRGISTTCMRTQGDTENE
jgi:hypothetical protein